MYIWWPYVLYSLCCAMCLPVMQVEAELQKVVAQWETDHGRDFVVHDACYLATIGDQWKHQKMEKEVHKAMRVSSTKST